jgi:peptidoglycan hydrolase-like protein with peptidoglycan-binding domain
MDFTAAPIGLAVGVKGVNRYNDTKTVQLLLNEHYLGDPYFQAEMDGAAGGLLAEDGICGPRTNSAIVTFQTIVMKKSRSWADGTVDPGGQTWKALNGNVNSTSDINPTYISDQVQGAVGDALGNCGPYVPFKQGDYRVLIGHKRDTNDDKVIDDQDVQKTISGVGCCLCTLTMAATAIGARTAHWPANVAPAQLTPLTVNQIFKTAGIYLAGYKINTFDAPGVLGMAGSQFGFTPEGEYVQIPLNSRDLILAHMAQGWPVAAQVDYYGGETGDHWVLLTKPVNGDIADVEALDPASGGRMWFHPYGFMNDRYHYGLGAVRRGCLFGIGGPAGETYHSRREKQGKYIVQRFILLAPGG